MANFYGFRVVWDGFSVVLSKLATVYVYTLYRRELSFRSIVQSLLYELSQVLHPLVVQMITFLNLTLAQRTVDFLMEL